MVSFYMKFSIDKSITGGAILVKTKSICLLIILISLFIFSGVKVFAQSPTVDCQGTLRAWKADVSLRGYMKTHNCRCVASNRAPV